MLNVIKEGYTIRINLPGAYEKKGYSVKCSYKFNEKEQKYLLSMWLTRSDIDNDFKIDAQYIPGTRGTIRENIIKIVEYALLINYFDRYIQRYEYELKCFDRGNELLETEFSSTENSSKE